MRINEFFAIVGAIFVFFVILETFLYVGNDVRKRVIDFVEARSAGYDDFRGGYDMIREEDEKASLSEYVAFSVWERKDYDGHYVSYKDGVRSTCYDENESEMVVWFFGGSTVEGYRSENDCVTLPSHFSELLNNVSVVNMGVGGYYSTQEVFRFAQKLKMASEKPDIVIFYDGANDWAVARSGFDVHGDMGRIEMRFEKPLIAGFLDTVTGRLLLRASRVFSHKVLVGDSYDSYCDVYDLNMVIAYSLCERYNCTVLNFVQPMFSQSENVEDYKRFVAFLEKCDFAPIVVESLVDEAVYIDDFHVRGEGNRVFAQKVFKVLNERGLLV